MRCLLFCEECKKRDTCKRICKELNNYLKKKPKGRLYSDRHIERMEIPMNPNILETTIVNEVIKRKFGRKNVVKGEE